jgi:hypothetical protein
MPEMETTSIEALILANHVEAINGSLYLLVTSEWVCQFVCRGMKRMRTTPS